MDTKHKCGQLSPKALAMALGLLWGLYLFLLGLVITAFPSAKFFWVSKELLDMLATLYPGYSATILGSVAGLLWGVLCGAIGGALLAWTHNLALEKYC